MRKSTIFVTVDALIFKKSKGLVELLLIQRKKEPFKNRWALPGGFVEENEDLEVAAKRELFEETQLAVPHLEQLYAFGKPFRDPRSHVVSIAYWGFVNSEAVAKAADDAKAVGWFALHELPDLAFDHLEIVTFAVAKLPL